MIRIIMLLWLFAQPAAAEAVAPPGRVPIDTPRYAPAYPWLGTKIVQATIASEIAPPQGYGRVEVPAGSFADWLRHLPLKPRGTPVLLYDGTEKSDQEVHAAVVDIDVDSQDLQQCADAVIRLRAEYLYSRGTYSSIHFDFTSGDEAAFRKWIAGYRPTVRGSSVRWGRSAVRDSSYRAFRSYLDTVFMYAGTLSLSRELLPVADVKQMEIGDVFIVGGSPGHAVIVVDMVERPADGRRLFLLAQSYMPAQDIHVLRNPADPGLSPWYAVDFPRFLSTPEWVFERNELMRFARE
jgi:hypothetical protein